MTDLEKRAYGKGYAAGSRHSWPENKPPMPTNEIVACLIKAAIDLRNEADSICATFGENDDITKQLGAKIDAVDFALVAITEWIKTT